MHRIAGVLASCLGLIGCAANGDDRTAASVASTTDPQATTLADEELTAEPPTTTDAPPETTRPATVATTPPAPPATVGSTTPTLTITTTPPQTVATVPVTAPGGTTTTVAASTTIVPSTTTSSTVAVVPDPPLDSLLLSSADLGDEWDVGNIESYEGERDAEIAEACPSADALNRIDLQLEWQVEFSAPEILSIQQMIGSYPSAAAALADVEETASIASCDLDEFFVGSETSAGPLDIADVDAASTFVVDSSGGGGAYVAVVVIAVGRVVSLIIVTDSSEPGELDGFVDVAAAKIVRLTR